jgi:hypothetical protein
MLFDFYSSTTKSEPLFVLQQLPGYFIKEKAYASYAERNIAKLNTTLNNVRCLFHSSIWAIVQHHPKCIESLYHQLWPTKHHVFFNFHIPHSEAKK